MEIEKLSTYNYVIEYLKKEKRKKHLLLGNGFSINYNKEIFSYNALSTFIDRIEDELLKKFFALINTKNFELVMQELDNFHEIAKEFSNDSKFVERIKSASDNLKFNLIKAVEALHPEHVYTIPEEKSIKCFNFFKEYIENNECIFTTNYDLLLYWVTMRNETKKAIDGFGRDVIKTAKETGSGEAEMSELRWGNNKEEQSVFYLHGALHLFDTGAEVVKEEYSVKEYLIHKIRKRMEEKEYPIFVTAGNGKEKLIHIAHNKYLSFCYDKLTNITGSLITFGFNFGDYDQHIIEAINKAAHFGSRSGDKLFSIYIGVFSDDSYNKLKEKERLFKCKVNYFNSHTVNCWN